MKRHTLRMAIAIGLCLIATYAKPAARADFSGEYMPYAAFDALPSTEIAVEGGKLTVAFAPGRFTLPKARVLEWLTESANAISTYYGRFPVANARVLIVPISGRGVRGGTAFGFRGPAMRLMVGTDSTEWDLKRDWKAVHEMVHLATPNLSRRHLWFTEGLATYVESIARAQAGYLTPQKIWSDFVRDMPQGLPRDDNDGLDGTTRWGRLYWGGAIFCFIADMEIRKRSGNRVGLQDALRGVTDADGTIEKSWSLQRLLKTADAAIDMTVLSELYTEMRNSTLDPGLNRRWLELGVIESGNSVRFDNDAALASVRRAIVAKPRSTSR